MLCNEKAKTGGLVAVRHLCGVQPGGAGIADVGRVRMGGVKRGLSRLRLIFRHGAELNRRVAVEKELLDMAAGKIPLPDREQCRIMALKLGTPRQYWPAGGQVSPVSTVDSK